MSAEVQQVEWVVARLRPHGRALFWPSVVLVLDAGACGYFAERFPQGWENLAVLIAAVLVAVLLWFVPLVSWLSRHYTITSRRVILRSGVAVRVRREVLHSQSFDVTVRQNGLQRMFGSGNIEIGAGGDHSVVLRDVPRAALVQAALHDLIEAAHRDETTAWGSR